MLLIKQILEVVRKNYDSLILKLQEGLEAYARYAERPHRALLARLAAAATLGAARAPAAALQRHSAALLDHYTMLA